MLSLKFLIHVEISKDEYGQQASTNDTERAGNGLSCTKKIVFL